MLTPLEIEALRLSLLVGVWAVAGSILPAITVAYLLARGTFPGRSLLAALVYLPLVLPPVVTGYGLLLLLGRQGPLGSLLDQYLGITFVFHWTGAAIASAVMGFPLMVRAIQLGFEAVDRNLEQAAASLGAARWAVFLTVTMPLSLPAILAGAIMGFAKSLGEFGATITFVSNIPGETRTLPNAIYSLLQVPGGDEAAMRLSLLSVVISILAVLGSELIGRRLRHGLGRP